jgi:hypothetical protein
MGLFGREATDDADTPPAATKKDDDPQEAPSTVCPCAAGNNALDWMKGFIEIKAYDVDPKLAQLRWDAIRRDGPLLYRNAHLGCFICRYVDPCRILCPQPFQECTLVPLLYPISTDCTCIPYGQAVSAARQETPIACGLGPQGCIACGALAWPIYACTFPPALITSVFFPLKFSCVAAFLTTYQRYRIIREYGLKDEWIGDGQAAQAGKLGLDCLCYCCAAWHQNIFLREMLTFGEAEAAGAIVTREPGGV